MVGVRGPNSSPSYNWKNGSETITTGAVWEIFRSIEHPSSGPKYKDDFMDKRQKTQAGGECLHRKTNSILTSKTPCFLCKNRHILVLLFCFFSACSVFLLQRFRFGHPLACSLVRSENVFFFCVGSTERSIEKTYAPSRTGGKTKTKKTTREKIKIVGNFEFWPGK